MKPTNESYRAATRVNVLSPEIVVIENADSVSELEGSMAKGVKGEPIADSPGSEAAARQRKVCVRTWDTRLYSRAGYPLTNRKA